MKTKITHCCENFYLWYLVKIRWWNLFEKNLELSQFSLIKVTSLKISNPDSVGVKELDQVLRKQKKACGNFRGNSLTFRRRLISLTSGYSNWFFYFFFGKINKFLKVFFALFLDLTIKSLESINLLIEMDFGKFDS